MGMLRMNKNLDTRAQLVFQRVVAFYNTLNVIAALVAGLSLAVLSFGEFHPVGTDLVSAAAGLLTSSALTGVVSVTVATMLMFRFEGHGAATRRELALAWSPLALLDLAIVEFLVGLTLWYAAGNAAWRVGLVGAQLLVLLAFASWVALWMWNSMSVKGGLGSQEMALMAGKVRVADE